MIPRRGLLADLGAILAAPAIIRTPGLLMPVRPLREPLLWPWMLDRAWIAGKLAEGRLDLDEWQVAASAGIQRITGCNAEMLSTPSRERTGVTTEAQRPQALTKWHVLDSKFRG